jgi:hypothetical protein
MSGKLATVIDQIEHGHHVYRAYFKHAVLKQYEKVSPAQPALLQQPQGLRVQGGLGQSRRHESEEKITGMMFNPTLAAVEIFPRGSTKEAAS